MADSTQILTEAVERQPLEQFTEKAYLEYAMYVILDRALPFVGDGLKPVQRRIVYAMSELGLKVTAKPKKSARTVGDVLGKFHPHGDSACYEAMVLMAQPFSYRYPLIDGQGNWGAPDDPKSFAAMRYTEARLSAYADVLLRELPLGTIDWVPNFDGTLEEPATLPARLPNVLLNGTSGIAVGMATDIPPHNLKEVAEACIHLLRHPKAGVAKLCEFIRGPDYPTAAEIVTPRDEIVRMYTTGSGSIRMRAAFHRENGDIVVTALPHQVSGARVIEQIATQMQAKKLPMVSDLRDESDHEEPIRVVITPRSNRVDTDALMAHLFATTDLERSYRVNMNVIGINGKPKVLGLVEMLRQWCDYRTETVRRRLQHRLDKVRSRLHILEGLLIAYLNIDEVIAIIRSEDRPKPVLMERFDLSAAQAEAILELRLRHLARLEEIKIRGEQEELAEERDTLASLLKSPKKLTQLLIKEIKADIKTYGDARRSPIVVRSEAQAITEADLLPVEPVTVILSASGWVRAAKGHDVEAEKLSYRGGDAYLAAVAGRSNLPAIFLDSTGRSYGLPAHSLPSARGFGEPLTGRLQPPVGARFIAVLMGEPDTELLVASDAGYGFVAKLSDLVTKNRAGKALLTLPSDAQPMPPWVFTADPDNLVVAVSNEGRLLAFPLDQLPHLAKGKGNKILHIPAARAKARKELLRHLMVLPLGWGLQLLAGKRKLGLKASHLQDFIGERGRRGKLLPRGFRNVDRLIALEPVQKALI